MTGRPRCQVRRLDRHPAVWRQILGDAGMQLWSVRASISATGASPGSTLSVAGPTPREPCWIGNTGRVAKKFPAACDLAGRIVQPAVLIQSPPA
jgi:hypothetical protein